MPSMIIGSGLLARAFYQPFGMKDNACIYAAGVSNSRCIDSSEFNRELLRLMDALNQYERHDLFMYFSTCSVFDPLANVSDYVQHKLRMEKLVSQHPRHLILRLPQVAGDTVNPHTLLNFIFARISRSEKFQVWKNARRNIVDVEDVVRIASHLVNVDGLRNACVNVANVVDISMPELVEVMEKVVGKKSVCEFLNCGDTYLIDTIRIQPVAERCGITFDQNYTERVIHKYYER